MTKYEALPTLSLDTEKVTLCTDALPKILQMDDPALSIMTHLSEAIQKTIREDMTIDDALNTIKTHNIQVLFVVDAHEKTIGIITSEDILGEKPIKIQQERRIPREKLLVKLLMIKLTDIPAINFNDVEKFKIGNIVNTLKENHCYYLLVIKQEGDKQIIHGVFTASEMSHQLHINISD